MGEMISKFASWLKELFEWLGQKIFESIMDAAAKLIENIPVPSFFNTASAKIGQLGADVGYWIGPFELDFGVGVILTAYTLRFILRRIPIIG
ncbi:MAG: hypothetical protein ABW146_06105 [Candidatus Sedimenticola sp. 6PFRAG7]